MKYKVCDRCGSHLDYGETCECVKEAEQEERVRNAENQKDQNRQVQNHGVLDRKAGERIHSVQNACKRPFGYRFPFHYEQRARGVEKGV